MKFLLNLNWPITISSFLLLSVGILVIYSSSPQLAFQQLIFACISWILFLFVSQLDIKSLRDYIYIFYTLILILLVGVLLLGIETRGSIRWIPLGAFNIQPSELAKPVLILFLANFWTKNIPNFKNIFKSIIFSLPLLLLVFQQPDLGSTLTLIAIWLGIFIISGVSFKKILTIILLGLVLIPLSWFSLQQYQRERVFGFLAPESDPLGRGYNLIQSTIAVGSGELFGRGLGRGTQSRLQFLPEYRTDFIFASIAEEMGFIGSSLILGLYLFLFISILSITKNTDETFSSLLIFGVISMLIFQTVVNIGMNIGILPITGITLPLISYGGSSLLSTFLCLGFASSAAKYRKKINPNQIGVDTSWEDM